MGKVCLGWVCRGMGWSWSGFVGVPLENTLTKTLFWLDLDFNLWYGKFKNPLSLISIVYIQLNGLNVRLGFSYFWAQKSAK